MLIATKRSKVVIYHEGPGPLKSHNLLRKCSLEVMWQIEYMISPLSECLSLLNFPGGDIQQAASNH